MKIERNNFLYQNRSNINFEAIRIRQITPEYSGLKRVLEHEIETFVKSGDNADVVGKGLSATVYSLKNFKDLVFKKSFTKKTDFADEIRNLKTLPEGLKTVQKFVAQAFDDETGIFYLLTTKMKGKPANALTNPYTENHLKNLFATFFELDKNGIYHGDFNLGNILLDNEGRANLIDFQWLQKIDEKRFFENKPKILLPPFILNENSQMFEMASFPFYIKDLQNGKAFMKTYLKEKSLYHENRAQYLKSILPAWRYKDEKSTILKGLNFENAQSLLFKNPDNDILKIETKKIQFLMNFREAFSRQDRNNPESNFITGISSHLMTLSTLQELRSEVSKIQKQKYLSTVKKDYLSSIEEYGAYWFKNISSWLDSMFAANIKQAVNIEHVKSNIDEFNDLTNITKNIDGRFKTYLKETFDILNETDATEIMQEIRKNQKRVSSSSYKLMFDVKFMKKQNEIKQTDKRLSDAINSGKAYDIINLSFLNIVKNRELKKIILSKNLKNKDEIITDLHNGRLLYEDLAKQTYKQALKEITEDLQI